MNAPRLLACLALIAAGCGTVPAAYRIAPPPVVEPGAARVAVSELRDARPQEERDGSGAGFMNQSTKDGSFSEPVAPAITLALADELRARNVDAVVDRTGAAYRVSGTIENYRGIMVPPRTSFIPYVKYATWVCTTDLMQIGVAIKIEVAGQSGVILSRDYVVARDTQSWVGPLGIADTSRNWNRNQLADVLKMALGEVLRRAAADIAFAIEVDRWK